MSSAVDNEYLQHAQIIQGVLIFLASCTAVLGYIVQSRLASAAAARQLEISRTERHKDERLKELRALLYEKVGPIQGLLQTGQNLLSSFACSVLNMDGFKYWSNELFDGVEDLMNCFNGKVAGRVNTATPFVSKSALLQIEQNPNGPVARAFRSTMRVAHGDYFEPAAELLRRHMNSLNFPTREDFIEKFPALKGDPQLRKRFFVDFMSWSSQVKALIKEWDREDYTHSFPPHASFPWPIVPYLNHMVDDVKNDIAAMTAGHMSFTNATQEENRKAMEEMLQLHGNKASSRPQGESGSSKDDGAGSPEKRRKKYAVVSAIGSAATASIAGAATAAAVQG